MTDKDFIRQTYQLAQTSAEAGFDPFGALLVLDGEVVAATADRCIVYSDPTAHAELILISEFCRQHKLISLAGYTLYCNVEPCVMCSGAIHWARLDRVVYGVSQASLQNTSGGKPKPGCRDLINTGGKPIEITGPVLEAEGQELLARFPFTSKKKKHKEYW
ncbi:MAG: nucleoside deaminase [Bacteroidota bacterium]